jgi:hypothetical protein
LQKLRIHLPNALANLLVIITSLGVSQLHFVRNFFIIIFFLFLFTFNNYLKFNKFTIYTLLLIILNLYFAIGALLFDSISSLWLLKDFIYLVLFDLVIKFRIKNSKTIYYILIIFATSTIIIDQIFQSDILGVYSPAFGFPRIYSVAAVALLFFLLFKHVQLYQKVFIFLTTFISFSASNLFLYLIYILKSIPIITFLSVTIFILTFNFENNELFQLVKQQKEISFENKINDTEKIEKYKDYEIAEVLSVELYQNSGLIFSIIVTLFIILYIYNISKSWLFSFFSFIMVSSNPMPLILILIIANLLNISNNENKKYSRVKYS